MHKLVIYKFFAYDFSLATQKLGL